LLIKKDFVLSSSIKTTIMQELITRLTEKAGINAQQATAAIDTIKDFVKEKFPMLSGAVDNMFASAPAATAQASAITPKAAEHGMLDKISDVITGETGQKVEDFAKNVAEKAEDAFDSAKEKLSGLFGGDKK
jgi:hypothetical protein